MDGRPKYLRLADQLEQWIRESGFQAGHKLPGDRQLVKDLGITSVTIGRALGELIGRGVVERRIGSGTYICDIPKRKWRIAVFCDEPMLDDSGYVTEVLSEIHSFWSLNGGEIQHIITAPDRFLSEYHERKLDGAILFHANRSRSVHEMMLRQNIPCVSLGICGERSLPQSFGYDIHRITEGAVRLLAEKGFRRIGIIRPFLPHLPAELRVQGYLEGMRKAGLSVGSEWILQQPAWKDDAGREKIKNIILSEDGPEVILISLVGIIVPIYTFLQNAGVRIPDDVSLLAFDNPSYAEHLNPPLSVFSVKNKVFTGEAMKCLYRLLEGKEYCPEPLDNQGYYLERESLRRPS